MELRRIQATRGGTFFVTLPKTWAVKNGINRGAIVAASEASNGRLTIDPRYDLEPTPLEVVIKPSPHLSREVIGKYLLGYDVIRLEAKDRITTEQREAVKQASSRLIGLEIMEEDYAKIVMQCLLEPSALSPEKILRREHLIASSMYRDAVTALIDRDVQLAKNVVARDNEVDRLYFLLVRILRTVVQNPSLTEKLKIYPIDCLDYRLTASLIESVADQSTQIAEDAVRFEDSKLSVESSNALSEIHKVVYDSYDDAVTAFFSRNISIADSVREKRATVEELYHNVESVASTLPVGSAQNLISVVSLINRIYDHSVDISDLTTPRTS